MEGQVPCRLEALLRALLEAAPQDALDARREHTLRARLLQRVQLQDRDHRLGRAVALERPAPEEHLVEDGAEGEDVGAMVGGQAAELFGGHVSDRADERARRGRGRRGDGGLFRPRLELGPGELGQAEVQDLHAPVVRDEEVRRLEIAVDDPLRVGHGQALRHLDRVVEGLAHRERALRKPRRQRVSLQELRHHVGRAIVGPDVVHGQDVGMVQRAGGAGFLLEATDAFGVLGDRGGQDLDRHFAPEAGVAGAIDLAHPAGADERQDLIGPE